MEKLYFKVIKLYLNLLSVIAPQHGGKTAINVFLTVRLKKIKEREKAFYSKAKAFTLEPKIVSNSHNIKYYELGEANTKIVFLIHGWNSNAGSLSRFAFELSKTHRVISLDLPAHAHSKGKRTNLFECKEVLKKFIAHINPKETFSIVGHSFGAAVVAYALSETQHHVDKVVLLSANNKLKIIFREFQKMIGFNDTIYNEIEKWIKSIFNLDLEKLILSDFIKKIKFNDLLIIHDKFDKVIPVKSAEEIKKAIPNIKLSVYQKIGHYRMLWNEDVVSETVKFIKE